MCQFNFIIIEKNSPINEIGKIATRNGLNFRAVSIKTTNPNILAFSTSKNECDCSSIIGKSNNQEDFDEIGETKKLARKRFPTSKIEKLIAEKRSRFEQKVHNRRLAEQLEFDSWVKVLNEVKEKKLVKRIGVLFKNFRGKLDKESINEFESVAFQINQDQLKYLEESELKWFV